MQHALGLVALLLPAAAAAQDPVSFGVKMLLREGQTLPGVPSEQLVHSFAGIGTNGVGGYAVVVNTSATGSHLDEVGHIWGSPTGGEGAVLRSATLNGFLEQKSFRPTVGIDDEGRLCYAAICKNVVTFKSSTHATFLDDTILAVEELPAPGMSSAAWDLSLAQDMTRDGVPAWFGSWTSGGSTGSSLYLGLDSPLYSVGDGFGHGLTVESLSFPAWSVSPDGSRHALNVGLSGSIFVVVDGSVLQLGGAPVQFFQPIPASIGGLPGESWGNFTRFDIDDGGSLVFAGLLNSPSLPSPAGVLVRDGNVAYRTGDVVDGIELEGPVSLLARDGAGRLLHAWGDSNCCPSTYRAALFLDDRLLLLQGQEMDVTGDGIADPGTSLVRLRRVDAAPDGTVYVTAFVDEAGTESALDDIECLYRIRTRSLVVQPDELSASGGGTVTFSMYAGAEQAGRVHLLLGSVSGTSPGIELPGGSLLPLNADAWFEQTLNAPNVPPLAGTVGFFDDCGEAGAQLTLVEGNDPALVGLVVHHAYVGITVPPVVFHVVSDAAAFTIVP